MAQTGGMQTLLARTAPGSGPACCPRSSCSTTAARRSPAWSPAG
ncbi:hypothetical protein ACFQX8_09115 [Klenkia terrae]